MTREETVKIIRIMVDSYPNYKPNNISETVDVWQMMLSEYTYEQISVALKAYILSDTNGFAPSIGQLVGKIQSITQPQELSEVEAWTLVRNAISNSGYNSVEEFAKLPPLVQKAVGLPENLREWAMTENLNHEVVSSNFMRSYKSVLEREKEIAKMPSEVRQLIQNATQGSYSAQIEQKREQAIKSLTERKESEIKALEAKEEYVPMPDYIKKRLEDWKNE